MTSSGITAREPQQNPVLVFSITLTQKRVRPPVWIILIHAELSSMRSLLVKTFITPTSHPLSNLCSMYLPCCIQTHKSLVILDGLQLRPLEPPASVRPHCRFAPGLPLLLCLKPSISHHLQNIAVTITELPGESRSVVVVATCRKSSHGRPVFQPALNLRCESSPAFPPCILSLCTTIVLSAWDVTGPLRTARESSCRRTWASRACVLVVYFFSRQLGQL